MPVVSFDAFSKGKPVSPVGAQPTQPLNEPSEPGVFARVGQQFSEAGDTISAAIKGEGEFAGKSDLNRGVHATAAAFSAPFEAATEFLPQPAREALATVGDVAAEGVQGLADIFSEIPGLQKWAVENPDEFAVLQDKLETTGASGMIAGSILGGKAKLPTTRLPKLGGARNTNEVIEAANGLRETVRSVIAEKTADPHLKSSAERLFLAGTDNVPDPVATYDEFLRQSLNHKASIKADPPIASVGTEIGEAFKQVVKQRKDVGAVMGDELKKIGNERVNLTEAFTDFESELFESGLRYNPQSKRLILGDTAKIAQEEGRLLERFIGDFNRIGINPTVAQVDALISRMNATIDYEKSARGITSTTNAERLIKGSLANLREAITDPKNPILKKYADARHAYSELSDFVNEGAQYLGKITQSGDFARDASLAKSAVQSILNNGKKDFLIALEELTGNPVLDKSVLALQAMADAGLVQGRSLLEIFSPGSIPLTKAGVASKILDFAVQAGTRAVAGSPAEQTRRFLLDLQNTVAK